MMTGRGMDKAEERKELAATVSCISKENRYARIISLKAG
jgi:hypothetical protein